MPEHIPTTDAELEEWSKFIGSMYCFDEPMKRLIAEVRRLRGELKKSDQDYDAICHEALAFKEQLEELREQLRWIPCSERMPGRMKRVDLIVGEDGMCNRAFAVYGELTSDGNNWNTDDDWYELEEVTHWREIGPLPGEGEGKT